MKRLSEVPMFMVSCFVTVLLSYPLAAAPSWEVVTTIPGSEFPVTVDSTRSTPFVSFYSDSIGAVISRGNHFLYTSDGGKTWTEHVVPTEPCLQIPEIVDENTIFVGCLCNYVKTSVDRGKSWTLLSLNAYPVISASDDGSVYFMKPGKLACISVNGASPVECTLPSEIGMSLLAISAVSEKTVYALGVRGILCRSDDTGATWTTTQITVPGDRNIVFKGKNTCAMRFRNEREGMIAAYDQKAGEWVVLETKNGGSTWTVDTLVKARAGTVSISRNLEYVSIVPLTGDIGVYVLYRKR